MFILTLYKGYNTMAQVKTAISIDETLFARAEQLAEDLKMSRSALYALALQELLREREQQQLTEELNAAYDGTVTDEDAAMLRGMRERQHRMAADDPW